MSHFVLEDYQLIARVLHRARLHADEVGMPNDERMILHLAHAFADELAATNPRFDRAGFIAAATDVSL